MILQFHPVALQEIEEAFQRLESIRSGLGVEFIAELRVHLERISSDPESLPQLETTRIVDVRRSYIHRFQYLVIFELRHQRVLVIAVSHAARRVDYWADRLDV